MVRKKSLLGLNRNFYIFLSCIKRLDPIIGYYYFSTFHMISDGMLPRLLGIGERMPVEYRQGCVNFSCLYSSQFTPSSKNTRKRSGSYPKVVIRLSVKREL